MRKIKTNLKNNSSNKFMLNNYPLVLSDVIQTDII